MLALTGTAQVWHVYLVALLLGMVTVVDNPTRQVFVAELVGDQHIGNAVSLNSSVFQFGALVGPALTGVTDRRRRAGLVLPDQRRCLRSWS